MPPTAGGRCPTARVESPPTESQPLRRLNNAVQQWNWYDTLTLLNSPQNYASIQGPANGWWPPISQSNQSVDVSPIFHDSDVPDVPFAVHADCYNANPRLMPDATSADPMLCANSGQMSNPGPGQLFHHRAPASVSDPSDKMLVWDGSLIISGNQIIGTGNAVDKSMDNSQWGAYGWGHCFSMTSPWFAQPQYPTPVAPGTGAGGASSGWPNSVTPTVQDVENVDDADPPVVERPGPPLSTQQQQNLQFAVRRWSRGDQSHG